jgi:phosphatidylserine decarboxylase
MRIAKEGYPIIAVPALIAVVAVVLGWTWIAVGFGIVASAVGGFFRDPDRTSPHGDGLILAPADGRIVDIREIDVASGDRRTRLSIFMSPLDVHVNRAPIAGRVEEVEYHKGCFMPAYKEGCSENNERNALTLIDAKGQAIKLVQIAGIMARRIVCRVKPGDRLEAGERFGIIMFGSRVDVLFPPAAKITVTERQHVTGGETILAQTV